MRITCADISIVALIAVLMAAAPVNAAKASDEAAADEGWPRIYDKADQRVVIHEPQIDSWENYLKLAARSAVAVTAGKGEKAVFGVISIKAPTVVDHASRTVLVKKPDTEIRFPNTDPVKAAGLEKLVREVLPNKESVVISLDRALAMMSNHQTASPEVEVNIDPPSIFYSDSPAVLVNFVGPPRFKQIQGTSLKAAVNTNWDIFLDGSSSKYYLLDGDAWLSAVDPVKGPWFPEKSAPLEISKLPADENWSAARAAIPGRKITKSPRVFASETPAELILTEGAPKLAPIAGTKLMRVQNTDSRLLFSLPEKKYYYSVAGRWFRAAGLDGPWTAATKDLPSEFASIPSDGESLSDLRASIPGTEEANDAILLAGTPEMATVKRDATIQVTYSAEPKFKPIQGTEVQFATNTPDQVFMVGGKYYCCHQGVWFESAAPTGPWAVCAVVPRGIYAIPVSHPAHNVTYVRVLDAGADGVVVGYTSGYRGEYVSYGALRFGAGVIVRVEDDDVDVYYLNSPPYYSYGAGAVYNWSNGGYYRAAAGYGPYGGAGRAGYYNPSTGAWARGAAVYGPVGGAYARQGYNPHTDTYKAQAGGSGIYGSWGRTYVERDDEWLRAGHRATNDGRVGWVESSNGGKAVRVKTNNRKGAVARDDDGNIYVGADDAIYRRDDDGGWSKREDGDWESVNAPEPRRDGAKPKIAGEPSTQPIRRQTPKARAAAEGRPSTMPADATAPPPRASNPTRPEVSTDRYAQLERDAAARSRGERNASRAARPAPKAAPAARGGRGRR